MKRSPAMRHGWFHVVWLAALPLASGCEVSRIHEESLAAAQSFVPAGTSAAEAPSLDPVACPSVDLAGFPGSTLLFVDVSQSMAGFTSGVRFREFDTVVGVLGAAFGQSNVVEFGHRDLYRSVQLGRQLHEEGTFDGENNPDFCLVQALLDSEGDRTVIYLSDGVQSDAVQGGLGPTVARLRAWLHRGGGLGILAFRGSFEGQLWSEQLQRWLERIAVEDRPFYAYIFTREAADLEGVMASLESVRETLPPWTAVRFGGPGPNCFAQPAINVYLGEDQPRWFHLEGSETVRQVTETVGPVADLVCEMPTEGPYSGVAADVEVVAYQWSGSEFALLDQPPQGVQLEAQRVREDGSASRSVAVVEGTVGQTVDTRARLFNVTLAGRGVGLRSDLTALSTDSDGVPEAASQTYRMSWLINDLARFDFDRVRPVSGFTFSVLYR